MFKHLSQLVRRDKDLPERAWRLEVFNRFLDDSIYDGLPYEFFQERDDQGQYVPISERAPSVRYALLNTVVNDSVSFLFGEGRFPTVYCADETAGATISKIIKNGRLNSVMLEAATIGSVGSIVVWVRVLGSRLFFEALPTTYLTPKFQANAPDTLESVTEKYKVKGRVLLGMGYAINEGDTAADFWFQRIWDEKAETWFMPWLVSQTGADGRAFDPQVDAQRTVVHSLGFVPMVWIKNLPGGDKIDGACTFKAAIEDSVEINYQLSQAGRGLKYSSSPTLVLKEGENALPDNRQHIVGDALVVPHEGDASLLEISGDAANAVIDYVREVRKLALESVGGSRADSDKLSAATSGRAMEMMNQSIINLADKLRASYGEEGLLDVLRIVAQVSRKISLIDRDGQKIPAIPQGTAFSLIWARFYSPTADDRQADAIAITTLTGAGVMSVETAIGAIANDFDIADVRAEVVKIQHDAKTGLQRGTSPPAPEQIPTQPQK